MYHAWLADEIEQGLYFSNCPDMIRYEPKIFKFPMCVLRTVPYLLRNLDGNVEKNKRVRLSWFTCLPRTGQEMQWKPFVKFTANVATSL